VKIGEPRTHTQLVLQLEYNGKRSGEPDSWQWQDSAYRMRGNSPQEEIEDGKRFMQRSGHSKFIRGWRIVERTTVTTDTVVEELVNG
jgi:hypothetical protein